METCRYFHGLRTRRTMSCELEKDIREVTGGESKGWLKRIPCVRSEYLSNQALCPSFAEITAEEKAEQEAPLKEKMDQIILTMPLISKAKKKYGETGGVLTEPCPVCGKPLHIAVSSYNGHTRGQCDCGKEVTALGTRLKQGKTRSCGCLIGHGKLFPKLEIRFQRLLCSQWRKPF